TWFRRATARRRAGHPGNAGGRKAGALTTRSNRGSAEPLALSDPIPNPRLGQNDTGVVGAFLNLLSQLPDIDAKILGIFGMCRSPHRSENLLVRHHASGVFC